MHRTTTGLLTDVNNLKNFERKEDRGALLGTPVVDTGAVHALSTVRSSAVNTNNTVLLVPNTRIGDDRIGQ